MSKAFADYQSAYESAVKQARQLNMDVGLEKCSGLFPGEKFRTFLLPKPENRYGHELRCEVVTPQCPKIER